MGLFSSKPKGPVVAPIPTHMTDSWFDDLIATTPAEAGLEASTANLSYIRDFLTLITIDEPIVSMLRAARGTAELRQFEDLVSSSESLGDRIAFLNGWRGPADVAEMEKRILRQRGQIVEDGREKGRFFDPSQGDPRKAMKNTLAIAARMRR